MKNRINLLLPKEQTLTDKVIYFALNYLKYILVITQIFVIGVFFYRFKVDQQIIDLKDGLMQKQEIVAVSKPLIDEARNTDHKIRIAREIMQRQENLKEMIDYLLSRFPADFMLDNLTVGNNEVSFNGIARNASIIQVFNNKLKSDNKFGTITLQNIQKTDLGYSFSFNLSQFKVKSL